MPRLVSGDIVITDNFLDTSGPGLSTAVRCTGAFVAMYVGADVRIERNIVIGNTRTGLAILDGTFDENGRGSLAIAHNNIFSSVNDTVASSASAACLASGISSGYDDRR